MYETTRGQPHSISTSCSIDSELIYSIPRIMAASCPHSEGDEFEPIAIRFRDGINRQRR
jgi:hypothetical protein